MTNVGSRSGLEQEFSAEIAQPVHEEVINPAAAYPATTGPSQQTRGASSTRRRRIWESLTASLDLACRGYLCMQIVDCDPVSDPDCSASGKKVVVREVLPQREQ